MQPNNLSTPPEKPQQPEPTTPPTPVNQSADSSPNQFFGSQPQQPAGTPTLPMDTVQPPRRKKRWLWVLVIVAAVLLLLGGGSAAAYFYWYQNPQKVLGDALVNALTAQTISTTGEIKVENDDYTVEMTLSARTASDARSTLAVDADITLPDAAEPVNVKGEGIFSETGDLYFKLDNVRAAVTQLAGTAEAGALEAYEPVIEIIEGQWIKVGASDLSETNEEYAVAQKCIADVMQTLQDDRSFRQTVVDELSNLYGEHPFITVEEQLSARDINGVGSLGYAVKGDAENYKAFVEKVDDTTIVKKLVECDDSINIAELSGDMGMVDEIEETDARAEIWVSRFGHELTELVAVTNDDEDKVSIRLNPLFNQSPAIEIPQDTMTFEEVITAVQQAFIEQFEAASAQ